MTETRIFSNRKLKRARKELRRILREEYDVEYSETQQWRDQCSGELAFTMTRGMRSSVDDYFEMVERRTQAERERRGIKIQKTPDPVKAQADYESRARMFQQAIGK